MSKYLFSNKICENQYKNIYIYQCALKIVDFSVSSKLFTITNDLAIARKIWPKLDNWSAQSVHYKKALNQGLLKIWTEHSHWFLQNLHNYFNLHVCPSFPRRRRRRRTFDFQILAVVSQSVTYKSCLYSWVPPDPWDPLPH